MKNLQIPHTILLSISALSLLIASCRHEAELPPIVAGINDSVCFETQVLPVIQSNCGKSGCHDGSREFRLNDYSSILSKVEPGKPNKSELYEVLNAMPGTERYMPPSPAQPLTNEQITLIQLWIMEGAKPTTCGDAGCDSVNVTYNGTLRPILNNTCTGCHSGSSPSASLDLTTYENVKNAVQSKAFVDHIYGRNGYSIMPPAPATPLSVCAIAQFKKWISDGMLP